MLPRKLLIPFRESTMYLHSSIRPCLSYLQSGEDLRETASVRFELSLSPAAHEEWGNPGLLYQYYWFTCELVRLLPVPHLVNLKYVRSYDYPGYLTGG